MADVFARKWLAAGLIALAGASTARGQGASVPDGAASTATATAASPSAPAAPQAVPTAADPALEAHMIAITSELRCLVCQNQTIADSHADLAVDLRQEVREMLRRGKTDAEIRRYMTDRYGDFVLYRPPFKPTTLVLWLGPALLMAVALGALGVVIARRSRLADDQFEPDPDLDADPADDGAHASSGTPA